MRSASLSPRATRLVVAAALAGMAAACASGGSLRPAAQAPAATADLDASLPPDDGDGSTLGLYLAAEAALDQGESAPAAVLFARASLAEPGDPGLRERAFTTNLLAGRVREAVRFTPLAGESAAGSVSLGRLVRAVDTLADGQGREAQALVSDGAVGPPYAEAAALLQPWAALAAGDGRAVAAAQTAKPGEAPMAGFAALGRARLLERAGRNAEAEVIFKGLAQSRQPLMVQAYGGFLERRGRRADAVKLYDAALQESSEPALLAARARAAANAPAPPQPTVRQAAAEAMIGPAASAIGGHQLETGLIYVRLALRLDPALDQAWLVVGDALAAAGDAAGARAAYGQVRDDAPEAASAWGRLAVGLQAQGDKDGAVTLARRAVARAPQDLQAQLLLAELLQQDERYADAITVLDPLVAKVGDGPAAQHLYFLRGSAEERAGRWPAAETDLKKALALKPDDPEVLNYLGFAWADRGLHLKEALAMLEKASAAASDQGAILDSVGWARFRLGDYRNAVRDLEKAVELEPADPSINDHLGDAYWRVGRQVEAGYQWRRVLTLDPDTATRAGVEAKLRGGVPPAAKPVAPAVAAVAS